MREIDCPIGCQDEQEGRLSSNGLMGKGIFTGIHRKYREHMSRKRKKSFEDVKEKGNNNGISAK